MPKNINNKGFAPIFIFIISILIMCVFIFSENIKNSLGVLSKKINSNSNDFLSQNNTNSNQIGQKDVLNYQRPTNVTGVTKKEKSYNYLENKNISLQRSDFILIYPENFDKNKAHVYFVNPNECYFFKGNRSEKSQKLGNSVFTVYDNVEVLEAFDKFKTIKKVKVVAQSSGRKLTGGDEKCGVLIYPNNSNLSGKISTKYPIEEEIIVSKDNTRMNKKVHLVIYDPKIDGKSIVQYYGWSNPRILTNGVINFFKKTSGNTLNFQIVKTTVVNDFPEKIATTGGEGDFRGRPFKYTSETYKECMKDTTKCFMPDEVNYISMIDSVKACEDLNAGRIDELWIWGGPYFGIYESHLVGRDNNTYFYNSSPTYYQKCSKPLPIMGFNYERGEGETIHNFVHRAESAIKYVFGDWRGEMTTGWNRFSLHNRDINNFAACGNGHFTPMGTKEEYIYDPKTTVRSNCHEFKNYPAINHEYKNITCAEWGCTEMGYYEYWFSNLPRNKGTNYDNYSKKNVLNNWWIYVFTPTSVNKKY